MSIFLIKISNYHLPQYLLEVKIILYSIYYLVQFSLCEVQINELSHLISIQLLFFSRGRLKKRKMETYEISKLTCIYIYIILNGEKNFNYLVFTRIVLNKILNTLDRISVKIQDVKYYRITLCKY